MCSYRKRVNVALYIIFNHIICPNKHNILNETTPTCLVERRHDNRLRHTPKVTPLHQVHLPLHVVYHLPRRTDQHQIVKFQPGGLLHKRVNEMGFCKDDITVVVLQAFHAATVTGVWVGVEGALVGFLADAALT